MRAFIKFGIVGLIAALAIMVPAIGTSANEMTASLPLTSLLTIQAESDGATAAYTVDMLPPAGSTFGGEYSWSLPSDSYIDLVADGKVLGTIRELELGYIADPVVNLRFAIESGSSSTVWTFHQGPLSFDTLHNPDAFATAAITITTADENGAVLNGQYDSGKCYKAVYNGSQTYRSLINSVTIPAGEDDSYIYKERYPVSGWTTIVGNVNSIESEFSFTLSAGDQASGTSRFEVQPVPEPGSLLALGSGLAATAGALLRRRRA
ncbi:MAG: PEP-CTERM sorting domain-containing protein [Armatimonadota bacterium]